MATIPSGNKFFSQAESVDTTYGGPAVLKAESAWFTIEDIAGSVTGVPTLDFTWSKEESYVSQRIDGTVYTLGISINNLTLDPSKKYNLLIKRYRYAERVKQDPETNIITYRTAGYKHESDAAASENNRSNSIQIATTDLTYHNFNQDFYFKDIQQVGSGDASMYATGTAKKQTGKTQKRGWVSLAFDLEIINKDKTKTIIENVGKITMISNVAEIEGGAFRRTISYNQVT